MVRAYESTGQKYRITAEEVKQKVDEACRKLKTRRDTERPRPGLDDKILCGWNGLMVSRPRSNLAVRLDPLGHGIGQSCPNFAG
jgi:uncharacterized protein YyaL (SSP411 family)